MSRFPLFPLLLSFSTTLQSACLQDKCSVQPFKDNDAECMPDMTISPDLSVLPDGNNNPDMTKLASFGTTLSYQFILKGSKKRVDSVGMIEVKKNSMTSKQIGQIGAILLDQSDLGIDVMVQTLETPSSGSSVDVKSPPHYNCVKKSNNQAESASFSRAGVTFFAKNMNSMNSMNNFLFFAPWFSVTGPIVISEKDTGQYYSLSSDVDGRIHAVINTNGNQSSLLASRNFLFYGDNLIKQMPVDMGGVDNTERYRVLVGNLDREQEPELITWDSMGSNAKLFKYDGTEFVNTSSNVPSVGASGGMIFPVALGDLNQDGLSDLIVADSSSIKIYYASGSIDNPFPMVRQVIPVPAATPVQAIAVSIPSGDDPPKLVWATSSFIQDSGNSTGTNTITINVLPIMN